MPRCPDCQKKFCVCEFLTRKLVKGLMKSTVLNAGFGEGTFSLHLYSLKRGEYYVQFELTNPISAKLVLSNEFVVNDRPPLLKSLYNFVIVASRWSPESTLFWFRSSETGESIYLEVKEKIDKLTFDDYSKKYVKSLLFNF